MTSLNAWRDMTRSAGSALWRQASVTGAELARRSALARQPQPVGVTSPRLALLLGEIGSAAKVRRAPVAQVQPAAHPQPVILIPGFGAHPLRMRRMLRGLQAAGHSAHDWGQGFNMGPSEALFELLVTRIVGLAEAEQAPVTLIGWSLGGLYAREIAKLVPDSIARVITMGTPFSGDRHANNAWRAYQFVTGHPVDEPPIAADFSTKPPVPTIALWSPRDGVVSPRSACGRPGERDRAVALRCSHLGFAADPEVIARVLALLDEDQA